MQPTLQRTPSRKAWLLALLLGCGCLAAVVCSLAAGAGLKIAGTRGLSHDSSYEPAWSPDGSQIAFSSTRDGPGDIYLMQGDGTNVVRLTNSFSSLKLSAWNNSPAWSPDGRRLAFVSNRQSAGDIYLMDSDGTDVVRLTDSRASGRYSSADPDWSPGGRQIVFSAGDIFHNNLFILSLDGTGLQQITRSPGIGDSSPCWSPDGQRILFDSKNPDTRLNQIVSIAPDGSDRLQLTGR